MSVERTELSQEGPVPAQTEALEKRQPGPADELRQIQMLLINGIFPGNVAPQVVKGYQYLDALAAKIEAEAKANEGSFTEKLKEQVADINKAEVAK